MIVEYVGPMHVTENGERYDRVRINTTPHAVFVSYYLCFNRVAKVMRGAVGRSERELVTFANEIVDACEHLPGWTVRIQPSELVVGVWYPVRLRASRSEPFLRNRLSKCYARLARGDVDLFDGKRTILRVPLSRAQHCYEVDGDPVSDEQQQELTREYKNAIVRR